MSTTSYTPTMLGNDDRDHDIGQTRRAHTTGRLSARYITALSAVAILSIAGQVLVQAVLTTHESDSRIINLAGRQRMLSQRIVRTAMLATRASDPGEHLAELRTLTDDWRAGHQGLREGDDSRGLPGDNSAAVRAEFDALEDSYQAMSSAVDAVLATPGTATEAIGLMLTHDTEFLRGMDRIVSLYERESSAKVRVLQQVELGLLALVLLTLLLEGLFVFRPAVRRIRDTVGSLRRSEAETAAILSAIPDSLLRVDHTGLIDAAYVPPPDAGHPVVGQPLSTVVGPQHQTTWAARLESAIARGEETSFEYHGENPAAYTEARVVPCAPDQALVILRDITERRELEKELLVVAEREQNRIGQDLHDGLCQHLAGLAILARTLNDRVEQGKVDDATTLAPELGSLADLLQDGLVTARELARGLFPEVLVERGLPAALQDICTTASHLHKVACSCTIDIGDLQLEQSTSFQLYRMAQEAVANAVRHGKAARIDLSITVEDDHLLLQVLDDGTGMSSAERARTDSGIGLRSMMTRARTIGATLRIEDNLPSGVKITCRLPLSP